MEEYNVMPEGCYNSFNRRDFSCQDVIDEFKEHGFHVTVDAIMHNYAAWCADFKSGYRDDENDVFLFTPCGCNDLCFNATHLEKDCEGWQQTYMF